MLLCNAGMPFVWCRVLATLMFQSMRPPLHCYLALSVVTVAWLSVRKRTLQQTLLQVAERPPAQVLRPSKTPGSVRNASVENGSQGKSNSSSNSLLSADNALLISLSKCRDTLELALLLAVLVVEQQSEEATDDLPRKHQNFECTSWQAQRSAVHSFMMPACYDADLGATILAYHSRTKAKDWRSGAFLLVGCY